MCNRNVDTITAMQKKIRSAKTITFLVESRLSKVTFMVNAAIYPNIFPLFIFSMLLKLRPLYIRTIDVVIKKFMEARTWALCIKNWMLERKKRVPVHLQTHEGNEI